MAISTTRSSDQKIVSKSGFCVSRIYILVAFIFFAAAAIIFRLYLLQVRGYEQYQALADQQHRHRGVIAPTRGNIFLKERDGSLYPAAVNRDMMTAFAISSEIENIDETAMRIGEILGIDAVELRNKLLDKNGNYKVIKRKLSDEEAVKIKDAKIKGVSIEAEDRRYYPGGSLAAQTIGFVGYKDDEIMGLYGVEAFFEDELKGRPGMVDQERDAGGRWISLGEKRSVPAKEGDSLVLSLDHAVQVKAELAIKSAVELHEADSGRLVIMDPYDGKIIAMAAYPTFDLNEYSKVEQMGHFKNPIVQDAYESGSVFKAFTMAMGLDSGKVTREMTYVDTGEVKEAGYTIKNSDFKANGQQTMTNVIEKSLNTGVIFVEKLVGNNQFLKYLKDFGFGARTGVDLPGEATGNISNLLSGRDIEFFTASFGQGITVTPLQLAVAYSAVANGGEFLKPQIIDRVLNESGETVRIIEKEPKRTVISRQASNDLALMLESNVINGHGKLAGVPGYRVAGKTGTAQIPDRENGGYLEGANVGSFAGFAPVDNPKFAMVVAIDNPKGVQWAESTAAPVFGELAQFMFEYYDIEPTEEYTAEDLAKFSQSHNYLKAKEEVGSEATAVPEDKEKKVDSDAKKKKKHKD